ncbi:BSD-domain-containing protein [Venturia nashicola]|uniref:BSD-domain-containing protein n=1 Tax=Venturia nashicola TaxID=86259 RepID=A0A4Z1P7C5_9PEZI|nr:BSD-domain-containing protein [Venturia nashicola]
MDTAYEHLQEETLAAEEEAKPEDDKTPQPSLNAEFQDAYKAFSSSPWGSRLGGLWGTVKKQSGHYYEEAQKEYTVASTTASKGINDLLTRTRGISLAQTNLEQSSTSEGPDRAADTAEASSSKEHVHPDRPESLPQDIVKEATGIVARFRAEAANRLKDIQKAEDAADEALLKFGTNITNFLKDAVSIAPPSEEEVDSGNSEVLFASKDAEGKRVIHTTRFDAQLHVIHCSLDSFMKDPASSEFEPWAKDFNVEKHTGDIAKHLEQYDELRRAMERLVPEKVEYTLFWTRYYFLRHIIESEEKRRKELLKGAASNNEEEVAWDEDSDEEEEDEEESEEEESEDEDEDEDSDDEESATPKNITGSTTTLKKPVTQPETTKEKDADNATLKPEQRRSQDLNSTAGSDVSYDIVSGASSRTPGSPREAVKEEESDEEDWE